MKMEKKIKAKKEKTWKRIEIKALVKKEREDVLPLTLEKKHELQRLPYTYDALEPFMDKQTVIIHHDKHHQTYVDNLNLALDKHPELYIVELGKLLSDLNKVPEDIRVAVRNHGGGVWNHNMFWEILKKDTKMPKEIAEAVNKNLGGYEKFKEEFKKTALGQFGSGWAWLVLNKGKLEIVKTSNQDTPLSEGKIPLLTIDVWEHSYYLKYQNRRAEYVDNFFNIINWEEVNRRYLEAKKK
jgi:Fe-Mn family superoxide dismutase